MPIDVKLLIENEFEAFKDPIEKRGPRHRSQKIGLNLNRKHQNVIAFSQKADPNAVGPLERLRNIKHGRGFVTHQVGMNLKQKYGLDTDDGYLGTTGIRLIRTDKGYDLIKEANLNVDGRGVKVKDPDDIFEQVPGSHTTFVVFNNTVIYGPETHYDIADRAMKGKFSELKSYPPASKELFIELAKSYTYFRAEWNEKNPNDSIWYGEGNPRKFFNISGRASEPEFNIVAFWNPLSAVNRYEKLLTGFFRVIGLPNPIIVTPDNPNAKLGQTNITQKIVKQAMEKQHLIPALKKMNTAAQYNKTGEVAAKAGYQTSAELNANKTIGDSVTPVRMVTETPEVILGKYFRGNYISYMFMGTIDGKGAVFGTEKQFTTHSDIIYAISKNKIDGLVFLGNATTNRKQYTHDMAGVILPKQGDDILATYISFWSAQGKEILPLIDAYMKQIDAEAPFFIEVSSLEMHPDACGTVEPYTPRG